MQSDVKARIRSIKEDRTHGAGKLAEYALLAYKRAAELSVAGDADAFMEDMEETARALAAARPTMAALVNLAGVALSETAESGLTGVEELREAAENAADHLLADIRTAERKASEAAAEAVPQGGVVLTLSYSRLCLEALVQCREKKVRVIVAESRPRCEGRVMAAELARRGVNVTLCTDAAIGHMMREADVAWSGADTILEDGSVINRMGTYLLALAAADAGVPYHALCQVYKFRPGDDAPALEEMAPEELGQQVQGVAVRNVYFDVTPARLVKSLYTERGGIKPNRVKRLAARWRTGMELLRPKGGA